MRRLFGVLYTSPLLYRVASTVPFAGQWRRWQRLALAYVRGRTVLEVGCGLGTLLEDLLRAGYRCVAVDRSPQMVAAARRRLRRAGLSARIERAEVQALPCGDASVETVVSTFPAEYIADVHALREIARVLRPGGALVIVLGARLVPTSVLLWPLLAVQTAVYGRSARGATCLGSATWGDRLPLAEAGLSLVAAPCVRGPFWEAMLLVAEKPAHGGREVAGETTVARSDTCSQ